MNYHIAALLITQVVIDSVWNADWSEIRRVDISEVSLRENVHNLLNVVIKLATTIKKRFEFY